MKIDKKLLERSQNKCELCGSEEGLQVFKVEPTTYAESEIVVCKTCADQIENPENMDPNHWRCLNDSMWSEVPAVQVISWRMLHRLKDEGWPQSLLDMMYLDEETQEWAEATGEGGDEEKVVHKDSNGVVLQNGDSVVLIKDLKVSGGGFTAKRGTAVRRISLVHDNPEHIEGRVEGQQIVILTQYVKKI